MWRRTPSQSGYHPLQEPLLDVPASPPRYTAKNVVHYALLEADSAMKSKNPVQANDMRNVLTTLRYRNELADTPEVRNIITKLDSHIGESWKSNTPASDLSRVENVRKQLSPDEQLSPHVRKDLEYGARFLTPDGTKLMYGTILALRALTRAKKLPNLTIADKCSIGTMIRALKDNIPAAWTAEDQNHIMDHNPSFNHSELCSDRGFMKAVNTEWKPSNPQTIFDQIRYTM